MKELNKRAEHTILEVYFHDSVIELKLDIDVAPIDGNYGYYLRGDLIVYDEEIYQVILTKSLTHSGKQSITIISPFSRTPKQGEKIIHIGNNLIEKL
jgi:hypothetical protein